MNRADIESRYVVEGGVIRSPGEYEGHPVYAPYFFDCAVAGGYVTGEKPREEVFLVIAAQDREEYPEIGRDRYAHVVARGGQFSACTTTNRPQKSDVGSGSS